MTTDKTKKHITEFSVEDLVNFEYGLKAWLKNHSGYHSELSGLLLIKNKSSFDKLLIKSFRNTLAKVLKITSHIRKAEQSEITLK